MEQQFTGQGFEQYLWEIEGLLEELTQDMGIHRNDGGHQDERLVVPAY